MQTDALRTASGCARSESRRRHRSGATWLLWFTVLAVLVATGARANIEPPALEAAADIVYPGGLSRPVTGVVALRFAVTISGAATDITILEQNHPAFVTAVLDALRQSRFRPALRDGMPFQAIIETTIEIPPPPAVITAARAAVIDGTVFEKGSRRPVAGAEVAAGPDAVTTTDRLGRFRLHLPPGPVTVTVAASGFELARFVERLHADERLTVVYRLRPQTVSPLELIVEAEYERAEVSRVRLDTQEIRSVPGTFDDAIRVVQKLPGVAQANEFSGDLLVRGSDARDTIVYIDGIQVPFVFHFGAIKSVIATDIIADVTLYPGNFSVRYGDAIGGVLNVRIRDPRTDRWQGRALVSSLLSEAVAEGPAGTCGGLQVGARSSYAHLFLDRVIPENAGVGFSTLPKFRDYQFRYTCKRNRFTLRTFIFGAQDELTFLGDRDRTLDPESPFNRFAQRTNEHSQSIQLVWSGRRVSGTTIVGHTRSRFRIHLATADRFDIADDLLTIRSDWEWNVARRVRLALGVDTLTTFQNIDIYLPRPPRPGEFDYDFLTVERRLYRQQDTYARGGLYAELRTNPIDTLEAALGIRLNQDSLSGVATADPRALVRWNAPAVGTLKFGYGIYHQYAQGVETAPEPAGNPDVGPNRAHHALLGWQRDLPWGLEGTVELFYKRIDRLIAENPDPFAAAPYQNHGRGRAWGSELTLRKRLSDALSGWINWSFTRSFRRIAPGEPEEPFSFDQPHILNIVASWLPSSAWELGGAFRYASGVPRNRLLQTLYFADRATFLPIYGERDERQPPFVRLDVRVKHTWLYDRWNLAALLEILNLLNRKNVLFEDFNGQAGEREQVNGFPILPYIGVEAKF